MHRFFVSPESLTHSSIELPGAVVHQVTRVLRLHPGEHILLLDGQGWEVEAELGVDGRAIPLERRSATGEPRTNLTLYQAVLKGEKLEWALQKCTEIGVTQFVLVRTQRTVVDQVSPVRLARWQRIVQEAAEQCRRGSVPALSGPMPFATAVSQTKGATRLLAWEEAGGNGLSAWLRQPQVSVDLFIGPEGGFTADEVALATQQQIAIVSLGPRILRAETAGLVTVSALFAAWGEFE